MFKAVFANNKFLLTKLVEDILDYYKLNINIRGKELIIKRNELNIDTYKDKQLICDYIIKVDDDHELNIEINKSKYIGLSERNLTYSFKIYYEHFKAGDDYHEFNKYTFLQVNFNNFANPNKKTINRYYMIDADDLQNKLSNNFSIMNIDIAKCYKLIYNKSNLEEISNLEIWGGIMACNYREDIVSILERGPKFMSKEETGVFLDAVDKASSNKEVQEDLRLEKTWEERWQWIEAIARDDMKEKAKKELRGEVTKQVTEELTEQITADLTKQVTADVTKQVTADVIDNIIKSMLQKDISYLDISDITGKSINYIKDIERSLH